MRLGIGRNIQDCPFASLSYGASRSRRVRRNSQARAQSRRDGDVVDPQLRVRTGAEMERNAKDNTACVKRTTIRHPFV